MKTLRFLLFAGLLFNIPQGFASLERLHVPPYKTIGNPKAPVGGVLRMAVISDLGTLHPVQLYSQAGMLIRSLVTDSLLEYDPSTNKYWPGLAEAVMSGGKVSDFKFRLRKGVRFHNGDKFSAEDVQFGFEAAVSKAFKAEHRIPYFDSIKWVKAGEKNDVLVKFKRPYFFNFDVAVNKYSPIVPKGLYNNPKKRMTKVMVGSGPYRLGAVEKGKRVTLIRNKKWWGFKQNYLKGKYNFDKIVIHLVASEKAAMDMIRQGKIDYYHPVSLGYFFDKKLKKQIGKNYKFIKVKNAMPKPYSFIAWNLKNPKFKDPMVRLALAHLMNRELINAKFRLGTSQLATGPWSRFSEYADPTVKPIKFDPEKALDLLNEAGWLDKDLDGIREKEIDGKTVQLAFNIFLPNQNVKKYFLTYREDLNRAGVAMAVRDIDMQSLLRVIASGKFDAVSLGWGRGELDLDPKQIWHSDSKKVGGSNFISYSNAEVDRLIELGRKTIGREKRIKIFRQVYRLIAKDVPYLFLFNDQEEYYIMSRSLGQPKASFAYGIGWEYFWSKKVAKN